MAKMTTTYATQCTGDRIEQRQSVFDPIDPTAMADLWIGNTEWAYEIVSEIARSSQFPFEDKAERADRIKDFMVEQFLGEESPIGVGKGEFFVTDLVQKAIATIDYGELVDRYSEE
jgi:hypothetical protein